MIRVLVPIDAFSQVTLSATYFALEFAKRNPAKIFFLIMAEPEAGGDSPERTSREKHWQDLFKQLLQQGRERQVSLEIHHSQEDCLTAISRVVTQQYIDDIIIAVPPPTDQTYTQIQRLIELLRRQLRCNIITVKPKEIGNMLDSWEKKETIS